MEWEQYATIEPFEYADDHRTARLMCLLANINRNPKTHPYPYTFSDFMPVYSGVDSPKGSRLEMRKPITEKKQWDRFAGAIMRSVA